MFNRIVALLAIALVPLVATGVGHKIESVYEAEWRQIVTNPPPNLARNILASGTLSQFCAAAPGESAPLICSWYKHVPYLKTGGMLALLLGFLLLTAVYFMGRNVRRDRQQLVSAFVPGLYGVFSGLIVLTALHGFLIAATLVLGVIATLGRPSLFEIFAAIGVVLMTVFALIVLIYGMLSTVTRVKTEVVGKRLTPEGAPNLWNQVHVLAAKLGALTPDNLIVGLEPTFFVTEAAVKRVGGYFQGRTLYLSLPLCRILSAEELRAVIGHELGHFRGADTVFSQKFYPIYRSVTTSLFALEASQHGGLRGLVLLPAAAILKLYMEAFESAESEIGRERELVADQAGAEASSARALASSLVKLHAFGYYYLSARDRLCESLTAGKSAGNLSLLFGDYVKSEATASHFVGLDAEKLPHPTDTHPPLGVRLEALGCTLESIEPAALDVAPQGKAVELVDDYLSIEKELTDLETKYLVKIGEAQGA